jgi:hypothetical protein
MFNNLTSLIWRGKDWYNTSRKEIRLSSNVKIKNALLSEELESECKKQNNILTYAEYLYIDQFGKNGYYAKSKLHGKTDIEKRWSHALAAYCKKLGYDTIIEFGCGTGELGVATVKAYKLQTNKQLKWIGVEIDKQIHKRIYNNFALHNLQNSILAIVTSLDDLASLHNALIVFPYSLDNIPPQAFLNTKSTDSYPNALLGITVKQGKLTEVIIPSEILGKKGIKLKNGFFTQNNYTCKLTGWKLKKGQRAYITIDSYITIYTYAKKFKTNTTMVIIDEFRNEPWSINLENLGMPKSLYENNLVCYDRPRYYLESGEHNLYYPLYKNSLYQFLHSVGFQSIDYDIEQKKAARLGEKPWIQIPKNYSTHAFLTNSWVDKKPDILPIPFRSQKVF